MSTSVEEFQSDSTSPSTNRNRWSVAVLLLVLTIAGGVAARTVTGPHPPLFPPHAAGLEFRAPDGGPVHFLGRLDRGSVMAGGDGLVNMELIIRGDEGSDRELVRTPTDLVVVLDQSGSMRGEPMAHALASNRQLLSSLSAEDRFSLITYSTYAHTAIPLSVASPEAQARWTMLLGRVRPNGGTNMAAGIDRATQAVAQLRESGRTPRVILLSDGHANEGDSSFQGLVERAARAVKGEYVLSAVGLGHGFDEQLMTAIADAGAGNFYYVQRSDELGEIFAGEFAAARENMASGLRVEITTEPGIEVVSAAGYPLERRGDHIVFHPGSLFAGQERRLWVSLRVPVHDVDASGEDARGLGQFALSYSREGRSHTLRFDETPVISRVVTEDQFLADLDTEVWEKNVVDEQLGALKQAVAGAVRAGRKEAAKLALRSFAASQGPMNDSVDSKKVKDLLGSVEEMEAEVDAAFAAPSPQERNELSKRYSLEGYDRRRSGAKY